MTAKDQEHLQLLSVFHYVVAGIAALVACIPFIHLFLGFAMASGRLPDTSGDQGVQMIGCFMMAIAGGVILAGWTYAVCLFLAGKALVRGEKYTFCLVIAAISCVFTPFGTVLGIFTLIVLMRDSVRRGFGVVTSAPE